MRLAGRRRLDWRPALAGPALESAPRQLSAAAYPLWAAVHIALFCYRCFIPLLHMCCLLFLCVVAYRTHQMLNRLGPLYTMKRHPQGMGKAAEQGRTTPWLW